MKNYKIADCCANCKYVFELVEFDCNNEYYCSLKAPERPKCGSTYMNENLETREESDKWNKWRKKRRVEAIGKCDCWENQ